MKDWHRALHPHELGLGCNSNPSPKSSWASPIQTSIPNLSLVPQLKPKSKDINVQAQDTQSLQKLGPFNWVQPSKAQIHSHLSLGRSITWSFHFRQRRRRNWRWEASSGALEAGPSCRRSASRVRATPFVSSNNAPPLPALPQISAGRLLAISSFEFAGNCDGTLTTW